MILQLTPIVRNPLSGASVGPGTDDDDTFIIIIVEFGVIDVRLTVMFTVGVTGTLYDIIDVFEYVDEQFAVVEDGHGVLGRIAITEVNMVLDIGMEGEETSVVFVILDDGSGIAVDIPWT